MNNKEITIIGSGGHAKVIIDLAEDSGFTIIAVYDENPSKSKVFSYNIMHLFPSCDDTVIIAVGNNFVRQRIARQLDAKFETLVHFSSFISKYSSIGVGTVIMAGVSINADVLVGIHCILNTNCSIDHDCVIHDFVHISPNVALAGNVTIGECTHIGIGACVKQGVKIGANCIIGAGAVIITDIPDGMTIVGNPGREINGNKKLI